MLTFKGLFLLFFQHVLQSLWPVKEKKINKTVISAYLATPAKVQSTVIMYTQRQNGTKS